MRRHTSSGAIETVGRDAAPACVCQKVTSARVASWLGPCGLPSWACAGARSSPGWRAGQKDPPLMPVRGQIWSRIHGPEAAALLPGMWVADVQAEKKRTYVPAACCCCALDSQSAACDGV